MRFNPRTLALVFTFSSLILAESIGDRLWRSCYLLGFVEHPLTSYQAFTEGWHNLSPSCVPGRGYQFAHLRPSGPFKERPVWLLYNEAGQLSGFGVRVFGQVPQNLVPRFWIPVEGSPETYDIFITAREDMCNGEGPVLGDRLLINGEFPIPVWENEAEKAGWYRGNCINGLGTHWSYDLATPGYMSWNASTLVPVTPMYSEGKIYGLMFTSVDIPNANPAEMWEQWEPRDFCSFWRREDFKACLASTDVYFWTTTHFHLIQPTLDSC